MIILLLTYGCIPKILIILSILVRSDSVSFVIYTMTIATSYVLNYHSPDSGSQSHNVIMIILEVLKV